MHISQGSRCVDPTGGNQLTSISTHFSLVRDRYSFIKMRSAMGDRQSDTDWMEESRIKRAPEEEREEKVSQPGLKGPGGGATRWSRTVEEWLPWSVAIAGHAKGGRGGGEGERGRPTSGEEIHPSPPRIKALLLKLSDTA